jgi:hypothetical protein
MKPNNLKFSLDTKRCAEIISLAEGLALRACFKVEGFHAPKVLVHALRLFHE